MMDKSESKINGYWDERNMNETERVVADKRKTAGRQQTRGGEKTLVSEKISIDEDNAWTMTIIGHG